MGNVGRLFCVALPFILTVAALVALLVGGLGGVADKNMYMFSVNTANLTISENTLASLVNRRDLSNTPTLTKRVIDTSALESAAAEATKALGGAAADATKAIASLLPQATAAVGSGLDKTVTDLIGTGGANLTAADVGLANSYDISLWGFCYVGQDNNRVCSAPKFNWAEQEFNGTAKNLENIGTLTGKKLKLPTEISKGLEAFSTLTRATQIVLIGAYVLLGVELLLGLFTSCSRAMSCLTWVVAGLAATAVVAAAAMATATSAAVVGAIEGSAKIYGVRAAFNTRFLAAMWIAAACAIGAAMFWVFTICCCAPEKRPHRKAGGGHSEKSGPYAPLHDPEHNGQFNRNSHQMTGYGGGPMAPRQMGGRSDLAYEPYSNQHR